MNYKLGSLIAFYVTLFLCTACGERRNATSVVYKDRFPIDTMLPIKTYPADQLVHPSQVNRIGNRVIAFGGYEEVGIYDYPNLRFIKKMVLPGRFSVSQEKDCLYFETEGTVDVYTLKSDSLCKISSFLIDKVSENLGTVQELSPGVYIYADRKKHSGLSEYHMTNIQTGKNTSGGHYPEGYIRFKKLEDFKLAYFHYLMVKPDKNAFVVAYSSLRRIRIYDRNENLRHDVFLEGLPGNDKIVPTRPLEQYWHFSRPFVTNKYIYLINPNQLGAGPLLPHCNVLVLDWEGNLIAKYRFNVLLNDIFVDEERNLLCGSCSDYEGTRFFKMDLLDDIYE